MLRTLTEDDVVFLSRPTTLLDAWLLVVHPALAALFTVSLRDGCRDVGPLERNIPGDVKLDLVDQAPVLELSPALLFAHVVVMMLALNVVAGAEHGSDKHPVRFLALTMLLHEHHEPQML